MLRFNGDKRAGKRPSEAKADSNFVRTWHRG